MKEGDCLQSNYTSITKNLDYEEHHNYNLHILSLCRRERGREEGREREGGMEETGIENKEKQSSVST